MTQAQSLIRMADGNFQLIDGPMPEGFAGQLVQSGVRAGTLLQSNLEINTSQPPVLIGLKLEKVHAIQTCRVGVRDEDGNVYKEAIINKSDFDEDYYTFIEDLKMSTPHRRARRGTGLGPQPKEEAAIATATNQAPKRRPRTAHVA